MNTIENTQKPSAHAAQQARSLHGHAVSAKDVAQGSNTTLQPEDGKRFSVAMHKKDLGHAPVDEPHSLTVGELLAGKQLRTSSPSQKTSTTDTEESAAQPRPTPGEAILTALQQGRSDVPAAPHAGQTTPAPAVTREPPLTSRLADRILISASDAQTTPSEIRISLKETVLPETEIHIQRTGDSLSVRFSTTSNLADQTLSPQLRDLQHLLTQRFDGDVKVSLVRPDMGGDVKVSLARPDMDGNAQGDGRSRQQRNLFEELAAEQRKK